MQAEVASLDSAREAFHAGDYVKALALTTDADPVRSEIAEARAAAARR